MILHIVINKLDNLQQLDSGRYIVLIPQRSQAGKPGLILDSRESATSLTDVLQKEQRFSQLTRQLPEQAAKLAKQAEIAAQKRYALVELLAKQQADQEQ